MRQFATKSPSRSLEVPVEPHAIPVVALAAHACKQNKHPFEYALLVPFDKNHLLVELSTFLSFKPLFKGDENNFNDRKKIY